MESAVTIKISKLFGSKTLKAVNFDAVELNIFKYGNIDNAISIPVEKLNAFRYGYRRINGYAFTIGWHYFIEIRDDDKLVTSIKFNSYYHIKKHQYYKTWTELINQLWKNYFASNASYYHELYKIGQVFELCGVHFFDAGIRWDEKNMLQWHEIGISNYANYFMIYNTQNKRQHKSYSFANDWNAAVLQSVLKAVVTERKMAK